MNQVQYVGSQLLRSVGIRHGWFMRFGGVSEGLFESLNGKKGSGDTDENVDENRKRALSMLCHPELVEGSDRISPQGRDNAIAHIIHEFKTNILNAEKPGEFEYYDAIITTKKDLVLSQTTADCGSIIITDTEGSIVALVHGSWHTLRDKIVYDVVAKIKEHTSSELIAGLGPMICKNCYEFGAEAANLFDQRYLMSMPFGHSRPDRESSINMDPRIKSEDDKDGVEKYLVDLKQMIIDQLHESGITKIDDVNICTLEDKRFFSHRRSGANSGRILTLATLS